MRTVIGLPVDLPEFNSRIFRERFRDLDRAITAAVKESNSDRNNPETLTLRICIDEIGSALSMYADSHEAVDAAVEELSDAVSTLEEFAMNHLTPEEDEKVRVEAVKMVINGEK